MPALSIRNLSKSFGETQVLKGINLELTEGELLVVLGSSGCGKSTLLRVIAGLEAGDKGEIYLGERRIDELQPKDRDVAMVFQNYSLYPHMTVAANLAFPLKVARIPKQEIKQKVAVTAELLSITDKLQQRPAQLSGGQRQRVALGRAIIRAPKLFLLDEPLSNLDADLRTRMRMEIVNLQKRINTTTIHVTHDQTEALTMADRIAVINEGRILQMGTPEELYNRPRELFVAKFIGTPRINQIPVRVENDRIQPFDLDASLMRVSRWPARVIAGLRPEAIAITPNGTYEGRVTGCEYLGDEYVVSLRFDELELTASGCKTPYEVGANVRFGFKAELLLFFDAQSGKAVG